VMKEEFEDTKEVIRQRIDNTMTKRKSTKGQITIYLCPTQFSYHRMFVSFSSNTTGTTCREQELLTLPEHPSSPRVLSWIRVARSWSAG
jgi:hypothetical protein